MSQAAKKAPATVAPPSSSKDAPVAANTVPAPAAKSGFHIPSFLLGALLIGLISFGWQTYGASVIVSVQAVAKQMTPAVPIVFEPLQANLTWGAIVRNVDLATLTDAQFQEIQAGLIKHQLLLFRDQEIEPAHQVAFAKRFGKIESFPARDESQLADHPEVFVVSNQKERGYTDVGPYWHNDGSMRVYASTVSMWRIIEVPKTGGDTLFNNQYLIADSFTPEQRELYEQLVTVHPTGCVRSFMSAHPFTKKVIPHINICGKTMGFAYRDMLDPKARNFNASAWIPATLHDKVMDELHDAFNNYTGGVTYAHKWLRGDMIAVENYSVMHHATYCDPSSLRVLHRTTVEGRFPSDMRKLAMPRQDRRRGPQGPGPQGPGAPGAHGGPPQDRARRPPFQFQGKPGQPPVGQEPPARDFYATDADGNAAPEDDN